MIENTWDAALYDARRVTRMYLDIYSELAQS